jgi:hypothetical protein
MRRLTARGQGGHSNAARSLLGWVLVGLVAPACGILWGGTESGNPSAEDTSQVPNLDDMIDSNPEISGKIPVNGTTAPTPPSTRPSTSASHGDPGVPASAPSVSVSPEPSVPEVRPSTEPPEPGVSSGPAVVVPSQVPGAVNSHPNTATSMPIGSVPQPPPSTSSGSVPAEGCSQDACEAAALAAADQLLECLSGVGAESACGTGTDAGTASCQTLCGQTEQGLAADAALSRTVVVLSSQCVPPSLSVGDCQYVLLVDSAACFEGPSLDPVACP